jgi:hypothetical protein
MVEIGLLHFLIICPLVFLAGFVDAVAGGGGLISLPAYLLAGLPVHNAIATNKLSSSMGTTLACWRYARSGFINWRIAPFCIVCAFIGSSVGANLALFIRDDIFKIIMLFVLPLTGVYVLRCQNLGGEEKAAYSLGKATALAMLSALLIGAYDGFYGPGTGTFLILLLTGIAHMRLADANGLSKIINLSTNLAALTVFLLNGKVIVLLGLPAGLFSILGNYVGTRCFVKGGVKFVRPVILLVLAIFFVRVLSEILQA